MAALKKKTAGGGVGAGIALVAAASTPAYAPLPRIDISVSYQHIWGRVVQTGEMAWKDGRGAARGGVGTGDSVRVSFMMFVRIVGA
jgi:hypothetical protein